MPEIKTLSNMNQEEIGHFISDVQESCLDIKYDHLQAVTKIFIKLKKTNTGYELFNQLSKLNIDEYDELSEIQNNWDIRQAKIVLDEIQWRLKLINELELKIHNPNCDELHKLQPLFEKGLWIFGPEFESIEFTSNKTLASVIKKLFKKNNINVENPLLRPDFVVIPDETSIGFHSSDSFYDGGEVKGINKILILELKKSECTISLNHIQQTQRYIQQLKDGGYIVPKMEVVVFILGNSVVVDEDMMGKNVKIIPITYDTILNRAKRRLFNLNKKIREIKQINNDIDDDVVKEVLKQETLI